MKMITPSTLVLVPTPLSLDLPLDPCAFEVITKAMEMYQRDVIIVFEELKEGRRRWINWGFPRDKIDEFLLLNEHNFKEQSENLLLKLLNKKIVFLFSDGGLPAFYDPGKELVEMCHKNEILVTATPIENSVSLALALSGFNHQRFLFVGFLPKKSPDREKELKNIIACKECVVLMDTPYRLSRVLEELKNAGLKKEICVAMDLNKETESVVRGKISKVYEKLKNIKAEFVLIVSNDQEDFLK